MHTYDVRQVFRTQAELGECPLWRVADQCLYWLDIVGSTINRFNPQNKGNESWPVPSDPGCFVFREGGGALVAARDGMYDVDFASGAVLKTAPVPYDPAHLRFNDGRTDRQGRLWAGTVQADMVSSGTETAFYKFDGVRFDMMISPVGMANGTAFSPDGRTMYRAQTLDRLIFAYDYDPASGVPSCERIFAVVPEDLGLPDGATVDTEGAYWVALPAPPEGGKAGIARYLPNGGLDLFIETPVPMPTMVGFGGPDLSTLFVTSGRLQPWVKYQVPESAGSIFAVDTPYRGIPEVEFRRT